MKATVTRITSLLSTIIFAVLIGTAFSDDKPSQAEPPKPLPAGGYRSEWRDFTTADLRDIRLNAGSGSFTFTVGESTYTYAPNSDTPSGANVSACIAVLAELRRVQTFKAHVAIPPKETKSYRLIELVISFDNLK